MPTTWPAASCSSASWSEAGDREAVFEGEVVGLIGAGAFVAFGEGLQYEGMLPVRRLRGDWWELNEQGTILVGTRGRAAPSGSGTRCRCGSDGSTRRGVGWICSPLTQREE